MAVLGGRIGENPQEFREERGVQVPLLTLLFAPGPVAERLWPGLNLTPPFFA
jgi:hypothetical protein